MAYGEKENTVGEWSIDKLAFLDRYLPVFAKAAQKAKHRYYIDAFAGNGEWLHRETGAYVEGSASIALRNVSGFTRQFFVEMDDGRVNNLKGLVDKFKAHDKADVLQGDTNKVLPTLMQKIHKKAPTFVFLDPSGDQLHWSTIECLSEWKTELFILYPYHMTIQRYLPVDKTKQANWQKERLNNFFGTNEWFEIYQSKPREYLLFDLLELYTKRLESLGYEYRNVSKCFKSHTGQSLYYMIWVGKHPVGKKIMDWVFEKQDPQLSLDL